MSSSSATSSSVGSEAACRRPSHRRDFQIAIICALPLEYDAATLLIDEFWDEDDRQYGRTSGDANTYRNGRIGMHNVVLMLLPNMGKAAVAGSAASLRTSYSSLKIAFLVGVCGGVPFLGSKEALLGDVVIGEAIIQYDFGRQYPGEFVPKEAIDSTQNVPNKDIRTLLAYYKSEMGMEDLRKSTANHLRVLQQTAKKRRYRRSYRYPGRMDDRLFAAAYRHKHHDRPCCSGVEKFCDEAAQSSCAEVGCDEGQLVSRQRLEEKRYLNKDEAQCPEIYIGRVASADTVMKSGLHRDQIAKQHNIVAFEMEGAGLWDEAPCIVVKGLCDYADSHKNKNWQPFAAATAAAVVKAMLGRYTITDDGGPAAPIDTNRRDRLLQTNVETTRTSRNTSSFPSELVLRKPNGTETLRDAIFDFQTILTPEQHCELRTVRDVPDADAVLVFTAELDLLNRNRKGLSVASRLYSLLQSVRDFSAVVETLGPAHNDLASLIWGSVKMTMLISIRTTSYFERASENFMKLGRLFPRSFTRRFFVAASVQCKLPNANEKGPRHINTNLWSPLEQEFHRHAIDMEIHSRDVNEAIALAKANAHRQDQQLQTMGQKKSSKSQKLRRMLPQGNEKSVKFAELQSEVDRRRAMERRQQLLNFLSTHDYVTPLKQSRRKRYSGTLQWLFKTREFDRWINDSGSSLLWCSGKIGSGKTILTSSLIDKLLTDKQRSDVFVSFFFIQFDDQQSLSAETILKSIVQQALSASTLSREIESLLERMRLSLSSGLQEFLELLRKIAATFKTFYIAIDGIDGCSKQDRGDLLRNFSSLVASESNIKLFLAGRESVSSEIQNTFKTTDNHLSMGCSSVQTDIAIYVEAIVQDRLQSEELIVEDPSLIENIKAALTGGADGMFLWVSFQMDELALQRCDDDIRRAIHNLPRDLEGTFNRVLDRIISGRNEEIAKQIFRWVAAAKEPLSLDQLSEVLFIEIGQAFLKPERRPNGMRRISSWCENLVHVDEELKTVQFVHQSVQQFFIKKSHDARHNQFLINIEDADHYIGEICVTYLNLNDFRRTLARRRQPLPPMPPIAMAGAALRPQWQVAASFSSLWKFNLDTRGGSKAATAVEATTRVGDSREGIDAGHPFLAYASIHWIFHTTRFDRDKSKTWTLWEKMIGGGHELAKKPWDEGVSSTSSKAGLEWGCAYSHYALIRLLIQTKMATTHDKNQVLLEAANKSDVTLLDIVLENGGSGLEINHACRVAAGVDQLDILRKLIAAGADGQAALRAAARSGRKDAITYLLTVGDGQIAIRAAVEGDDQEAVRHLIQSGVDVQIVSQAVIKAGNQEAIQCLRSAGVDCLVLYQAARETGQKYRLERPLAADADIYFLLEAAAKNGDQYFVEFLSYARIDGKSALRVAAHRGDHHVVEELLAAGADGSSELRDAAKSGDLPTIRSLLAAGVNGADQLAHLIRHGISEEIQNLLAAGVDVNAEVSKSDCSALQLAVLEDRLDLSDSLLPPGADIAPNLQNLHEATAFHTAVGTGQIERVRKIIAAGADVNRKAAGPCGRTVLQSAAEHGHMDIVKLLLSAGADVNAEPADDHDQTALPAAAGNGHLDTVRLLLGALAKVNNAAPSQQLGETSSQAAAGNDHLGISSLLDADSDIDAAPSQQRGGTALWAALNGGHPRIAGILLHAGAGANTELNGCQETALQIACAKGYLDIVQMILDAGADVNAKPTDHAGNGTALQAAAARGHLGIVKMLLAAGADVDAIWPTVNQGQNALHNAAEGGYLDIVERLLDAGANVNAVPTSRYSHTALQAAAIHGHESVVERLLAAGADVDAKGSTFNRGNTALQEAVSNGHLRVVERLLDAGADVNAYPAWTIAQTALQAAAINGNLIMLERLLAAGADVNAKYRCGYGYTALEAAATRGNIRVVNRLLAAGAEIAPEWAASNDGQSAVMLFVKTGYLGAVERLLNAGAKIDCRWAASKEGQAAVWKALRKGYPSVAKRISAAKTT